MQIDFCVNGKSIQYFSAMYNVKKSNAKICKDSEITRDLIKKQRQKYKKNMELLFDVFFGNSKKDKKISVEAFPEYFSLGAVNVKDRIILLGQKQRSKYFYLGLLVHEIAHIYMYQISKNKLINEIICLLLEDFVYESLEFKGLNDVWDYKELDIFHRRAMKYAIKFYKQFKKNLEGKGSIKELVLFMKKNIDKKDKEITPPKGLLANLPTMQKG